MPNAAALGDATACPIGGAGAISGCACATVLVESRPVACLGDVIACPMGPEPVALGEVTVLAGGMPQARLGDPTWHGGTIVSGAASVFVGDGGGGGGGGGRGDGPAGEGPSSRSEPGACWDELVASEPDASDLWRRAAERDGGAMSTDEAEGPKGDFVGFAALHRDASDKGVQASRALYRAFPSRYRAFDLWFPNGLPASAPSEDADEPAADLEAKP